MIPLNIEAAPWGDLCQLADDLFWGRFDLPFRLNHINLYMLNTADGWVLIDTGLNDDITAQHWEALLAGPLAGKPVSQIIVTHHHVDHIGYAGPLAELTGAPVFASLAEADHAKWLYGLADEDFGNLLAKTYHCYGLPAEIVNAARSAGSRYRRNTAPLPKFCLLKAGDEIKTSAGSWCIRTDTGHSDAQLSLMDKDRGLFLSVDFLLPRISPNISADIRAPDFDLLSAYFTYLREMTELPENMQIFPGHDWPFRQGGERAQQLIAHHHHRLDLLHAAAQNASVTVCSAMDILFGRHFGDHEMYFASGEARAHLNYLVAVGRLHKYRDKNGVDIYNTQNAATR
jgi:glyoxylase-like metal-dependent hydrolase (beta-lactamase superfamily II)